jgi:hypothetical protein
VRDDGLPNGRAFLRDLVRSRPEAFDPWFGLGAAGVILAPLALGTLLGAGTAGVLVTLGALNLFLAALPRPHRSPDRLIALAAITNAVAFGAGGLVATLPVALELPCVAAGLTLPLLMGRNPWWEGLGVAAAVMFAVGVGLPVVGTGSAPLRAAAMLLGGAIGLLGWLALMRRAPAVRAREDPTPLIEPGMRVPLRAVAYYDLVVGLTAAAGFAIGIGLGLERDFWIMLTVLVALRPRFAVTLAYSVARILGTVLGASLAFVVTEYTANFAVLFAVLAFSAAVTIATRPVNNAFYAIWLTLFVIGLLNIVYTGGPGFAVTRILDTGIGGALAIAAGLLLSRTLPRGPGAAPADRSVPDRRPA